MPLFAGELTAEFDRDFVQGAAEVLEDYRQAVRRDGAVPRDTGTLAAGIDFKGQFARDGLGQFAAAPRQSFGLRGAEIFVEMTSTARGEGGVDYGSILDQSKGQTIVPKAKKALANTRTGWGPFASARLTTAHVGWWEKANKESYWRAAADRLSRFGL